MPQPFALDHLPGIALVAMLWLAFGFLHSLGANLAFKRRVAERTGRFTPAYRMVYNTLSHFAVAGVLAVLALAPSAPLTWWPTFPESLQGPVHAVLGALVFATLVQVGLLDFMGIKQVYHALRGRRPVGVDPTDSATAGNGLSTRWFYAFARHPMYVFGMLQAWSVPMTDVLLVSNITLTTYVLIGSRIEERRFVAMFGDEYRAYQQRVPAFLFFLRPAWVRGALQLIGGPRPRLAP